MADPSSAIASDTGRLQTSGVSTRSRRARPGPNDETVSSMPYGPPLTLKKATAASGRSRSSRRRGRLRAHRGADHLREPLDPLVDRHGGVHDDLDLSARQL